MLIFFISIERQSLCLWNPFCLHFKSVTIVKGGEVCSCLKKAQESYFFLEDL